MKQDFPILKKGIIYLDSASTTQKPRQVINAIKEFYENFNANVHRGIYSLSHIANEKYEEARKVISEFINAEFEEIIFTRNTTEGINLVANNLVNELNEKDEILITEMEHHSNLVPWQQLCRNKNIKLNFVKLKDRELDLDNLKNKVNENTKIVSLPHVSNVLGTINDVKKVREIIGNNIYLIVDGAQAVSHIKVDVKDLDVDFYAFSGHKMFGPSGIGILFGKKKNLEKMKPFLYGGDMISDVDFYDTKFNDVPYKFEAGTQNIEGVIGLKVAIDYINKIGLDKIRKNEEELRNYCLEKLKEIGNVEVYSNEKGVGIISFNIANDKEIHGHDVAYLLNEDNICVRTGFLCAQPLIKEKLKKDSVVRVSFHIYNDKDDVDKLISSLKEVQEKFK